MADYVREVAQEPAMPDYVHAHGCPALPDRIEVFDLERPAGQRGSGRYRVVRCIDCGAQTTTPIEGGDDGHRD